MLSFLSKILDILAVVLQNRDVLFADSKIKIRATEGSQNQAKSNNPFTSEILFWRSKKEKKKKKNTSNGSYSLHSEGCPFCNNQPLSVHDLKILLFRSRPTFDTSKSQDKILIWNIKVSSLYLL